jgi:DNA-binding response OmpR family regulator
MRPKKRILLIDADEERAGVSAFMLRTRGFAVIPVTNADQALTAVIEHELDLVLALGDFPDLNPLLMRLRAFSTARQMVYLPKAKVPTGIIADCYFPATSTVEDLVERCKIMSARKHGPRPHPKIVVAAAAGMELDLQRRTA